MSNPDPTPEHDFLRRMIGSWKVEGEEVSGVETVTPFGDVWVHVSGEGSWANGAHRYQHTLGFEPETGKFVGSFITTAMTKLWVYEGSLEGNTLTYECDGPSMNDDGTTMRYQDQWIVGDDERTLISSYLSSEGKWVEFMRSTLIRQ